ncbi:MAG: hypothetical protein ACOYOF_11450 [Verrucomicrobiaceae bacterium]
MKANSSILLIIAISCSVFGWGVRPHLTAQTASGNPTLPKPAADPSKPANDELRALILLLTERIKPSPNAMPNRGENGFVEDKKMILLLASEVLLLRERVEKLESKPTVPDAPR